MLCFFFFQAEDGIRDLTVTGVQTCALPISWSDRIRRDRSQILSRESVRMEPTPVNFHAKKLFQPDIAEVHFATEMVQQRKLASFVGRLEHHRIQAERLRNAIGISAMEVSLIVKTSQFFCALPCIHD